MIDIGNEMLRLLGPKGWLSGEQTLRYSRDWLDRYGVSAIGVARPVSTKEVADVVGYCHKMGVFVTPQGGNTSLCGASVTENSRSIIISLERMNAIDSPDSVSATIVVEAGVVLANLHVKLAASDSIFPMHLGAEGSAQVGGLIGSNAGGSHAMRYGMMQDLVVGLEVVLADGSVWDGMRAVQKDNSGYQLRRLFCGSEGTLGIVTRAVLKLYPAPKQKVTALLALPNIESLIEFGTVLRSQVGELINGLEFFSDVGLSMSLEHVTGLNFPLQTRADWYVLVELSVGSEQIPLMGILESVLTHGMENEWVVDGTVATSQAQENAIWRLREEQPEGQRLEGVQLKHDLSVPIGRIPDFINQASILCHAILPDVRINPFGHLGDGNIHYNLSPPEGHADFSGKDQALAIELSELVNSMRGSFSAEHGLGRSKIAMADKLRSSVERKLMSTIKTSLDPNGVLNPGVLISALK